MENPVYPLPVATKIFNYFSVDGKDHKKYPTKEEIIQRFEGQRSSKIKSHSKAANKKKSRGKKISNIRAIIQRHGRANEVQNINHISGRGLFNSNGDCTNDRTLRGPESSMPTSEDTRRRTTEKETGTWTNPFFSKSQRRLVEVKEWDGHSNRYLMNLNTRKFF